MPSPRHDALNQLIRNRPEAAVEMLRDLLDVDLPAEAPVRLESNDFNDRPSKDFRPDTVITVGPPQAPVHGIIVEIQQEKSKTKRKQLPRYAAALWLLLDCPVTVLVICPDAQAARWYAEPIPTDLPGYVLQTKVLGPDLIPVITDPCQVAAHPELAALSVMAHGRHRPVAEAFVAAVVGLRSEHAPKYYEYTYSMAAPAVRRILEEIMSSTAWPVYSPFAREHYGRGKSDGRVEGRAEGEAKVILLVLASRGLAVSDEVRERITSCTDLDQLEAWARMAATVETPEDLFR